ncbi:unnamed protein product [Mytilus coruscus]|uniref:Uncharacterized protein n=1 Tax=Mytilus coruscus TaxID=42192 RepID=A0A6J8DFE4_MYTCO|nr:unnamed protein product [Mytilus coruscus]
MDRMAIKTLNDDDYNYEHYEELVLKEFEDVTETIFWNDRVNYGIEKMIDYVKQHNLEYAWWKGANRTVKEQTVLVDVGDNKNVSALSVINNVETEVGESVVEACFPKSGNIYEITLKEIEAVDLVCDTGFKVNNETFKPNAVFSKEKMVSFLNVSCYVTDEEITK